MVSRGLTEELRQVPGLLELDAASGEVCLDRAALPRAAKRIVFGRGSSGLVVSEAAGELAGSSTILVVVGTSSSKTPAISALLDRLRRVTDALALTGSAEPPWTSGCLQATRDGYPQATHDASAGCRLAGSGSDFDRPTDLPGPAGPVTPNVEVLRVQGRADHAAIQAGIAAVQRTGASLVVAVGGGTILDVGKSVAALARQERGEDVAAFQLGQRQVVAERVLPWVAVPTTSGTGSESTDNAVIELGEEKRSIRGIPAASLIVADPALTDSLPLRPTVVAAVDALAQSLEVSTNSVASEDVQAVALAAFATLAKGIEELCAITAGGPGCGSVAAAGGETARNSGGRPGQVDSTTRDILSWGSLLMGIAFAHARLGLPHALVHFCSRFGLSHGHMVGILLAPGLAVQARDPETAKRLAGAAQVLQASSVLKSVETTYMRRAPLPLPDAPEPELLIRWLENRVGRLFTAVGLPSSLRAAGLARADLDWITVREMANRPALGIPARPATPDELEEVLEGALDTMGR
ncbi:MAG: iron-containing alcohol dehydrogenase [Bacillota bacterium]